MIFIKDTVLKQIAEIINIFNTITNGDASSTFSDGYCGYFTLILYNIFGDYKPKLYVQTKNEIHSIIKIENEFYDVNGIFNSIDDYIEVNLSEFMYFIDVCNIYKERKNIKYMEKACDFIIKKCKNNVKINKKGLTLYKKTDII